MVRDHVLLRIEKMQWGAAYGYKGEQKRMAVPCADAQTHFLHLALVVAKHNAIYRARYPDTDPIYQIVEKAFFGIFDDMPIQLHIFADAAEATFKFTAAEREAQARSIAEQLANARNWAGDPSRDNPGAVLWRKSLPFAGAALADEIERSARQFFASVYSLKNIDRRSLRPHEAAFWARFKRVRRAQRRAKRDREDLYSVILCLQPRLPTSCCTDIVRMAL